MTKNNNKQIKSIVITLLLAASTIPALLPMIHVEAGLVERQNALEALTFAETRVYLGNQGTIGMEGAAHPSILYRLIDAKVNNDNSLLGSTDELVNELSLLQQCMDLLVAGDDDYNLIQSESETLTGYKFNERVAILKDKMVQVGALAPECGINNVEKLQLVISISEDVIFNLEDIYSRFVVVFPDPALEAKIRSIIGKPTGDIYPSDLMGIINLEAYSAGITDLTGLEYCTSLQILYLGGNQIVDVTPLSGLTSLQGLELYNNQIVDVAPLSGLTSLVYLNLVNNQIVDVAPLSGLTSLTYLELQNNQIVNITLSGLTSLQILYLGGNQIVNITLSGLTSLSWLGLQYNQIVDVAPLSGLTSLTHLYLGSNQIVDVTPLSGLTSLQGLELYNNQIVDVAPLSGLTSLGSLSLGNNQIVDVAPLSGLTNLYTLSLYSNNIVDVAPLKGLTSLVLLYLMGNPLGPNHHDTIDYLISQGVIVYH